MRGQGRGKARSLLHRPAPHSSERVLWSRPARGVDPTGPQAAESHDCVPGDPDSAGKRTS